MAELQIDTQEMRRRASRLTSTRARLARIGDVADEASQHVGHEGLASKVQEFGDAWKITRSTLERNIETLTDALDAIADTFEDLDVRLSEQVQEGVER